MGSGIQAFFHCKKCLSKRPSHLSPREWARLEVGFTERGIQVRCVRCDVNVIHIDFQGKKHPADLTEEGSFSPAN